MAIKNKKAKKIKSSPKKVSLKNSKPSLKKKLVTVTGGKCFWLHNGPSLGNMRDLYNEIPKMSHEQYSYHANETKNDFAAWVEFVLMDPECAHNLKKCSNKSTARLCIAKALKKYS